MYLIVSMSMSMSGAVCLKASPWMCLKPGLFSGSIEAIGEDDLFTFTRDSSWRKVDNRRKRSSLR